MADTRPICRHCTTRRANRPRGLCWHCDQIPGLRQRYPSTSPYANRTAVVSPEAARLVLWGALVWAADGGAPSALTLSEWDRALAGLAPVEVAVVALYVIRGQPYSAVGAWLGVGRGRAQQLGRAALAKLKAGAGAEVLL